METNKFFKTIRQILIAIISIIMLVFIFQNFERVQVQFFTLQTEIRLAFLIFISILFGVLITILFSLPTYYKSLGNNK